MPHSEAVAELSAFLKTSGVATEKTLPALRAISTDIQTRLSGKSSTNELERSERSPLRSDIYLAAEAIAKLRKQEGLLNGSALAAGESLETDLEALTRYIPPWVKMAIALSLGLGTMVGWQRIVVTVGEKIGKTHLSYAQGAAAETGGGGHHRRRRSRRASR